MLIVRHFKISIWVIPLLITLAFCHAKTFADLNKLHNEPILKVDGSEWTLVPVPDSVEATGAYHLLNSEMGWAKFEINGQTQLFQRKKGTWRRIVCPNLRLIDPLFTISDDEVWLIVQSRHYYKQNILHYINGRWQLYETPNANRIRDIIFLSPEKGWAACDWGQLLKYDGRDWKLYPSPTTSHIDRIMVFSKNLFYAVGDWPKHELLKYENSKWEKAQNDKDQLYSLVRLFYYAEILGSAAQISGIYNILFPDLTKSTIQYDTLNIKSKSSPYIWASPQKSVRFENFSTVSQIIPGRVNNVLYLKYSKFDQINNTNFLTYDLISKRGIERRIVIEFPVDDKVSFTTVAEHERTQEAGICIFDFNHDSLEDFFSVVSGKANRFFISSPYPGSQHGSRWLNIAKEAELVGLTYTNGQRPNYDVSATCADIENDGDQDILVTSLYGPNELYKQIKKLKFKESARSLSLYADFARTQSGIWGDVNNDGFIDIFISNEDSSNHLYLNNGAGIFKDVTLQAGLYSERGGIGSVFGDIDNDGDLDLFVPRYGVPNKLYRNDCSSAVSDSIHFTDITEWSGVAGADTIARSSCGIFGDFDNDGDLDLFVTNVGQTNWLYLNQGDGRFVDCSDESGLASDILTHAAIYLDADNDGDLDLFVCNREGNKLYENDGKAIFTDARLKNLSHKRNYPSGIATGDFDNDGDMDIYYSDDQNFSLLFRNKKDDTHYIKISVSCSKSNRDGIGSEIFMYQGGHLKEHDYLLGMRHVRAGDGRNSMSSRIIHFGVADEKPKDFIVKFPSGIERKVLMVEPGRQITVFEEQGLHRRFSLLKKWYIRNIRYPYNQHEAFYVVLYIIFLFGLYYFVTKRKLSDPQKSLLLFIPCSLFLFFYFVLKGSNFFAHHILPITMSIGAWGLGFYVTKLYKSPTLQLEYQEKLFQATNAFFHGAWGARILNRLQLYCSNLSPGKPPDEKVRNALEETIHDYFTLILPEIERILSLAKACLDKNGTIGVCRNHFFMTSKAISELKTEMNLTSGITNESTRAVIDRIRLLRHDLSALRDSVLKEFICDVHSIVERIIHSFANRHAQISFHSAINNRVYVRIRAAECSQIIHNLIHNAIRAERNSQYKKIAVSLKANLDFVFIRVADSGCGVDKDIRDRLFIEQVTTKAGRGGFGLFQSRNILRKYGGDIYLVQTQQGIGSIFEIKLKRVEHG